MSKCSMSNKERKRFSDLENQSNLLGKVAFGMDSDVCAGFQQMKKGRKRQFKQRKSIEKKGREVPDAFRCRNGFNEN